MESNKTTNNNNSMAKLTEDLAIEFGYNLAICVIKKIAIHCSCFDYWSFDVCKINFSGIRQFKFDWRWADKAELPEFKKDDKNRGGLSYVVSDLELINYIGNATLEEGFKERLIDYFMDGINQTLTRIAQDEKELN